MTVPNKEKNTGRLSIFLNRLFIILFVLFLFNVNFDAFKVGAAVTVTGGGHVGFLAKWVESIPTVDITCDASLSQSCSIPYNTGTTINWTSSGATSCTMSPGGWTGLSGTGYGTGPLTVDTVWTANCSGPGGTAQDTVNITVNPINGVCGTANFGYSGGTTCYNHSQSSCPTQADTFCSLGTASPASPAFPTVGTPTNWTCIGSGPGHTNASCSATVSISTFSLTINSNAKPIGGSVNSTSDTNIKCDAANLLCSGTYSNGAVVTLTTIPDSSYWKFSGWSGACSGSSTTCSVTISGTTNVTATFVPRLYNYIEF